MKKLLCAASLVTVLFSGLMLTHAEETDTFDGENTSTCIALTFDMRTGSRDARTNGQVTDLQVFLQENDYLLSDPTGYFGVQTKKAVQSFQRAYGITPNGLVGPMTRAKIKSVSCDGNTEPTREPVGTKPTGKSPALQLSAESNTDRLSPGVVHFKATDGTGVCNNTLPSIDYGDGTSGTLSINSSLYTLNGVSNGSTPCNGYYGSHTYSKAGTYLVTVTRTIYNDCKSTNTTSCAAWYSMDEVGTLRVTVDAAAVTTPEPLPVTQTSFTYDGGIKNGSVTFNATESTRCDGKSQYSIEFGDGERGDLSPNWIATTNSYPGTQLCGGYYVKHTYVKPGTYSAKLYKTTSYTCPKVNGMMCSTVMPSPVLVGTLTVIVSGGETVQSPTISSLSSYTGTAGSKVSISGTGFLKQEYACTQSYPSNCSTTGGSNTVLFNGTTVSQSSADSNGSYLSFTVPSVPSGSYTVQVMNSNGKSNVVSFAVTNPITEPTVLPTFTYEGGIKSGYVTFKAIENTLCDGRSHYTIEYGDGEKGQLTPNWIATTNSYPTSSQGCGGYIASHTYVKPGTYNAQLFKTTQYTCPSVTMAPTNGISSTIMCSVLPATPVIVGTLTVTVSGYTAQAPVITSINPTAGPLGSKVTIMGNNFTIGEHNIYLDGILLETQRNTTGTMPTTLTFAIPTYFPQNCSPNMACTAVISPVLPGNHSISVQNTNGTSNSVSFLVTPGGSPFVLGASLMCVDLTSNLHRGAGTKEVMALQKFLTEKGLLNGDATGFFGDKTVAAVKDYQGMKGLPVSGMVYELTRESIRVETCQ